jgi:hypothetical protein
MDPEWWILERTNRVVGYAQLHACGDGGVRSFEAIALDEDGRTALLDGLESISRGRFLVLGPPFLDRWTPERLAERGYRQARGSFGVLMARGLGGSASRDTIRTALGADRPGYAVYAADSF